MKTNLLKSIFISLILLVGGISKISAATVTFTADDILFFNMSAVSWWTAGTNGNGNFAYFYNNSTGKNAWSAHAVLYSGSVYYVKIPAGTWEGVILTRNNTSTAPSWNNKWNQTGDILLSSTSNYISKFSEGSVDVTWGTQKPTSTGSLAASANSVNIGSSVTLTPSLTSNTTYNEINSTSYSISPSSGASISSEKFTATQAGTYTVTATVTYNPRGYSSLTSTVSPTVTITVKPWTITWDANGGSVSPATSEYDGATAVSLPTPTRTGYNFDGWYTAASGGTKINDIGTTTKPTSDVTYYAHWNPKTYTITLNVNGGASNGSATATYNSNSVTNATYPTREYYECNGYYTAASGGTLVLNTNGTLAKGVSGYTDANGKWTKDGTATLYAQWSPISFNINYEGLEGATHINPKTYTIEDEITFSNPSDRTGYDFVGWKPASIASGTTGDQTVTAQWQKKKYTVAYGVVGAANGTIALNGETPAIKDLNKQDLEHGAALTFTAEPADGYRILEPQGWFSDEAGKISLGNGTAESYTINSLTAQATVFVQFEEIPASIFMVTFNANGGSGGTMNSQSFTENEAQNLTANEFTRTGYTFSGWNTKADGSGTKYTDGQTVTLTTAGLTLYAQWTANQYTITFDKQNGTGGTDNVTVHYDNNDYSVKPIAVPSIPGYGFMGYYVAKNGSGFQVVDATGNWVANAHGYTDADGKWKNANNAILYAHFQKAQIASLTLDRTLFGSGATGYVTTSHTISPIPAGTVVVCWTLCYNNGTPVVGHDPIAEGNEVKFAIDGLRAGTYKVVAELHLNDRNGELLDNKEVSFVVAGSYTVTIQYTCGGETINASIKQSGNPTTTTPATAPEIGGYNFVKWVLGDGITTEDDLTSKTINYKAAYDGYLTATYEKKKLIFLDLSTLPNKDKWTAPHIYLYKETGYWNNDNGAGSKTGGNFLACAAMTKVPNTEYIWYYEYEDYKETFKQYVAFTATEQENTQHFSGEAIYRGDFTSGTPVFVPEAGQTPEKKNSNKALYYNKGYWVRYMGGTGYSLLIYNAAGDKELLREEFTSATQRMTMKSVVDLEANQTYKYEIYRHEGYYYKGKDITYQTKDYQPLNEAEKHSITTTETGDYTFTLDYSKGDLQIKVDYPVTVGDLRVLYKDNTRATYKPSQTIKTDEAEPVVGYFVRPGNNPELKVQTAARVTSEGVTWTTTENEIFFKPNANWKSNGARFAAWFSGDKWKDLNKNGDVYSCEIPSGATEVIFCRMDPKKTANNWDNKWNQTGHLSLTEKNQYTLNEGEWGNKLYLKPNSNWFQKDNEQKDPRFAAYFFNNNSDNTWVSMGNPVDGVYSCDIPAKVYKSVIFCRMNGGNETNDWSNKYNQSSDLTVPTDGKTLYTVKDGTWDNGGGSWSVKEGSWSTISGSIIDLTEELKEKLDEIKGDNKKAPDSVYTIYLSANGASIEKVVPYTGNFYIRVDAAAGKWYDYKTNPDNLMTYSAFSENEVVALDGEATYKSPYSHYKTAWCTEGQNVKFVIANDYSPCISDTLVQDSQFNNIDEHGNLKSDNGKYNTNIRFMWNRSTNKVSRAYLAAATDKTREFLVLKSNSTIKDTKDQTIADSKVLFDDTQNWIYETTVKVQPGTLFKLYACYPTTDVDKALYFRGEYANNGWTGTDASVLLGGSGDTWYTVRVIYDFKTNRLMTAWIPDNEDINGTLAINADVMVTRSHHDDAKCITFANDKSSLTEIKTVYGTLQFNRWILNNRANPNDLTVESCTKQEDNHRVFDEATTNTHHAPLPLAEQKSLYERGLYFVSFPFDVNLSDVFGFGTYGTHWVISKYNGLRRAQNGYFIDNCVNDDCTNWDYIWDPDEFVMKANEGYLLSLDLDLMRYDNTNFWSNNRATVELYFPSTANVQTIQQTNYTMPGLGEEYKCTIDYSHIEGKTDSDRRVKDSYWRCIGVPSFADYNNTLSDGTNPITWKPNGNNFPFLYEWNVSDNSLMVRAASTYKFRPTFAYLVQNGNQIKWSAVNNKPSSIVARQRTDAERNYEWRITLSRDENQEDQTFVRMTDYEEVTTAFDFNQDLIKELNYGRSDIYTLIGYERAAANSMPLSDSTTVVPLGLDIEQDGDYTIAMPEGVESVGVTLLDAETGERTNLSIGMDYTISLNKGACHNRLYLEISPIQQTTTDIEYTDQGTREQSVRKVLIDGKLYIVCDGVVYDAQGKRL